MELEKEIKTLQKFNDSIESKGSQGLNTLEIKKRELEEIIEYRTKGSMLRARCRWFNEGEETQSTYLIKKKWNICLQIKFLCFFPLLYFLKDMLCYFHSWRDNIRVNAEGSQIFQ